MAPPNATAIVDRLVGQGLVERAPDPGDRRAVRATPTERGRGIVEAFFTAGRTHLTDVLGELTDTEVETVRRGYSTFVRALRRRADGLAPRS
jgi:DNA-binding MarR family transcriptional regulator